ncbi:class I SAM-dependent methyltransferase [Achromobacter xylosoxidans]|uniref:class I SAM-dependent methyltransferase n=1 Tax=Alcaligenes xylosoxydans xylosoxydans TaxID=85698 RepID=UPI0006C18DA8|nr:class I SAM-dependent methyltransferase [Achromobacter xylosoxidans]MDH0523419.1 class I SAM-dependent methyltransferase [Achromobacter xylosoxidans]MDH0547186.1 class I SAM-dependent methyltransferase [Achromobacter xylosoxidans]MDZ5613841.1 class I SAM-dependent methyltransferase [Achromobacter xylosoxidans]MDZ5626727.1 class I SAM-dependent methyltransferase [Achromobacter xylosoxidans]MDZ5687118.1 class I SAM-dependent methyltransferase [Achromobacter xylosoxidans]
MTFAQTPGASDDYADRVARHVPGLRDLHRMIGVLMAEQTPADGHLLVLGAGGGLELKTLAESGPRWRLDGVDPSADMLRQARATLGELAPRATLRQGYIDDAPEGPYDGATCLLTLHFLGPQERLRTVREVSRRLRPGAPFIVAHHSFPLQRRDAWLTRNAAFITAAGVPAAQARDGMQAMRDKLPVLDPQADEAILRDAGFTDIELFYAALTFKGWVCRKA